MSQKPPTLTVLANRLVNIRNSKIKTLRPWQKNFFPFYDKNLLNQKYIGINIPTGFGKTLTGIVILQYYLNQGKTCAILTNTKALVKEIDEECKELKINSVILKTKGESKSIEDKRKRNVQKRSYTTAKAIRISTYDMELYSHDIPPADVLIVDDADSFVENMFKKSQIIIQRSELDDTFCKILSFLDPSNYQDLPEILNNEINTFEYQMVYWNESIKVQRYFKENLKDIMELAKNLTNKTLFYSLFSKTSHLVDYFPNFIMLFNSYSIIFQPYFPDFHITEKLELSKKLILMSATLGDQSLLKQEFGILDDFKFVTLDDLEIKMKTMGERMIFPIYGDEIFKPEDYSELCYKFSVEFSKSLFLMYNYTESNLLYNKLILNGKSVIQYQRQEDIELFNHYSSAYLISTGRYIGIDISQENQSYPCNICIITHIPYYVNPLDYAYDNIINKKEFLYNIVARRLIQSFGRCNRNEEAKAVYIVIDPELQNTFSNNNKYIPFLSDDIYRSLEEGFFRSDGGDVLSILETTKKFLSGEKTIQNSDEILKSDIIKPNDISQTSFLQTFEDEWKFWKYLFCNNIDLAINCINSAISVFNDNSFNINHHCWLLYLKCLAFEYGMDIDPSKYQVKFEETIENMKSISENQFYSKYFNQKRKFVELNDKVQSKDSILSEYGLNPEKLFVKVWNSDILNSLHSEIERKIKAMIEGYHKEAIHSFAVLLETIVRKCCNNVDVEGEDFDTFELSRLIEYLYSRKYITQKTFQIGSDYSDSSRNFRNELLHGLMETDRTEGNHILLNFTNFIQECILDLKFVQIMEKINWTEIKRNSQASHTREKTFEQIHNMQLKAWAKNDKIFDPDPNSRRELDLYNGVMVILRKKGPSEKFNIEIE